LEPQQWPILTTKKCQKLLADAAPNKLTMSMAEFSFAYWSDEKLVLFVLIVASAADKRHYTEAAQRFRWENVQAQLNTAGDAIKAELTFRGPHNSAKDCSMQWHGLHQPQRVKSLTRIVRLVPDFLESAEQNQLHWLNVALGGQQTVVTLGVQFRVQVNQQVYRGFGFLLTSLSVVQRYSPPDPRRDC
jgi:hypothetical protein